MESKERAIKTEVGKEKDRDRDRDRDRERERGKENRLALKRSIFVPNSNRTF